MQWAKDPLAIWMTTTRGCLSQANGKVKRSVNHHEGKTQKLAMEEAMKSWATDGPSQ